MVKNKNRFKRVGFAVILLLKGMLSVFAQISFTPYTLTWSADDTSAKTVTVHSPGWWDTDSTSHSSHFNLQQQWRYNNRGYPFHDALVLRHVLPSTHS